MPRPDGLEGHTLSESSWTRKVIRSRDGLGKADPQRRGEGQRLSGRGGVGVVTLNESQRVWGAAAIRS